MEQQQKPVLIYDGDCAYCAYQVRYWQRLTGDAVVYEPWQTAAGRYPEISREDFQGSIQLITPGGERYQGAAAAFRVVAMGGRPLAMRAYHHLPGYSWVSERLYTFVSHHRTGAGRSARFLWGKERYPAEYKNISWLFLRLLGLIYLAAFVSFGVQADGIIGSQGILPLGEYLQALTGQYGRDAWWSYPSVFWLGAGNTALQVVWLTGAVASLLLVANILTRLMLPLLFVLYLSVVYAGQVFFNFQWDTLLLETGFLAIFLPYGSPIILFLLHWVLFRLRFLSGASKLLSGDASWGDFTALNVYFETQPLPHVGAWLAHQLPDWLLRVSVGGVFFVELLVPFMIFLPRRPRMFAAWATIIMQLLIMLTSNHNFFNLLTLVLCVLLFDDRALQRLWSGKMGQLSLSPGRFAAGFAGLLAALIISTTLTMMWVTMAGRPLPAINGKVVQLMIQWRLVSNYHVFPVMNTKRLEVVVEGSEDERVWKAYEFKYKPGDLKQTPRFIVPHQPRLDWHMWFAALSPPYTPMSYWFDDFMLRLLEGSPDVLALIKTNPFPDGPPRYLRARLENYRFTTPEQRAATGDWWTREPAGIYFPSIYLLPE